MSWASFISASKDTHPSCCQCAVPSEYHWCQWYSHGGNAAGSWFLSAYAGSMSGAQMGWFSWWLHADLSYYPKQSWSGWRWKEAQNRSHITHCTINSDNINQANAKNQKGSCSMWRLVSETCVFADILWSSVGVRLGIRAVWVWCRCEIIPVKSSWKCYIWGTIKCTIDHCVVFKGRTEENSNLKLNVNYMKYTSKEEQYCHHSFPNGKNIAQHTAQRARRQTCESWKSQKQIELGFLRTWRYSSKDGFGTGKKTHDIQ